MSIAFTKKFKIKSAGSNFGIGAVLSQEGYSIAYASRTLTKTEANYSTIEEKLLAIAWDVKYFRLYTYLYEPLNWLQIKYTGTDISARLQRCWLQLGEDNI